MWASPTPPHEPDTGGPAASWQQILGEVLADEGAERTTHKGRAEKISKGDTMRRLASEYDYLAHRAESENLA